MPFSVPQSIQDFFSKYPDAKDVFIVENGKAYLNHYEDKALKEAKVSGNTLYKVDKNLTVTQVYPVLPPVLKTYSGTANIPFVDVSVNDQTVEVPDPASELASIQQALEEAANLADVTFENISLSESEGILTTTITTYQTVVIKVGGNTLVLQ